MAIDNESKAFLGADVVLEMHQSMLNIARSQYESTINRLWAGCGGGLVTVVGVLRHPNCPFFWLSAVSFIIGLVFLSIGLIITIIMATINIRVLEGSPGILQVQMKFVRPSSQAGLTPWHPQTWTGICAGGLFVAGVVFAGALVDRLPN